MKPERKIWDKDFTSHALSGNDFLDVLLTTQVTKTSQIGFHDNI